MRYGFKPWLFAIIPGILLVILLIFFVGIFLVKILWSWTVPDLFPGAVEQGLITREISWFTALKISIFIAVLAGLTGIKHHKEHD